jgi:hypothetical protein
MNYIKKITFKISMLLVVWAVLGTQIFAQPPDTGNDNIPDQEVNERLSWINNSLEKGEPGSRLWFWSFMGLYSAGTITQLSLYFAASEIESDPEKQEYLRQDMMTGTITTALGVIFLLAPPMPSINARDQYSGMPEENAETRKLKLEKAEDMLYASAKWEKENRAPIIHILNFGLNLGAGLVIWLGFQRTIVDGLITFIPGFIIGEIQLFTQPTRAERDWEQYEKQYVMKTAVDIKKNDDDQLHFAAIPGGFVITKEF